MTIEELFRKYLDDRMTVEELRLFREAANRPENRAVLDRLLAQYIGREFPFPQSEDIDIDALYSELTQNKHVPVAPGGAIAAGGAGASISVGRAGVSWHGDTRPRLRGRIVSFRIAAVAAACILLVAGLFLLRRSSARSVAPTPTIAKAAVIVPAGDRAVLTLADGTHILLDSAANGQLASQGNTRVLKLANGQLAYRAGAGSVAPLLYNEIATPRGGFYRLILPDGSAVWLDAASSLRYPTAFTGKDRSVELSGEAYFEIAPRSNQPFLITTRGVTVEVLGTEFNLMAYQDEEAIRTTLVSGSVRVVRGDERQQIRPGQQASWANGAKGWALSTPDMREVLAWKQGGFRFQGLSIAAIMRQIARWYDVDVEFRGPQPSREFNGIISRKKSVNDLLTVLEQTDDVHFTLQGRKIMVEAGPRASGQ
jgi:transmembrane sensor